MDLIIKDLKMDRIRRFQRFMILTLTALNTLVYCVSQKVSAQNTLLILLISLTIAFACIKMVEFYLKRRKKHTLANSQLQTDLDSMQVNHKKVA